MRIVILLLLALLAVSNGQLLSNPKHIYASETNGITTQMIGVPMTACSQTVVIRDNSENCYKYATMDGEVYDTACTPEMKQAFDMVIYASAGYLIMPNGNIIIIDMYSGDPIDIVTPTSWTGISNLVEPYKVGLWTSFATPTLTHTWVVASGRVNTSFYQLSWTQKPEDNWSNTYSGYYIMQLNNAAPVMTLFSCLSGHFMIVLEGGTAVSIYRWERASAAPNNKLVRTIPSLGGVISAVGGDFYGRIYMWDTLCNCLVVKKASDGSLVHQTPLPDVVNPFNIQVTRNKVFIHHENGVTRYDLPVLGATFTPPTPQKCATTGSPLWINAYNGAPPYTTRVVPDILSEQSAAQIPTFTYNWTTSNARYREPYTTTFELYDDEIAFEYEIVSSGGGEISTITQESEVKPFSGDSALRLLMNKEVRYNLRSDNGFSATFFSGLEMWVNVGSGLDRWRIDLPGFSGTSLYPFLFNDYYAADFQPNTWTKVTFDFSLYGRVAYDKIVFADYSNSNATDAYLYIDKIRLIPYNNSDLLLMVRDFCNATVLSPWYSNWNGDNILKASVDSQPATCPASELETKATGSLNAIVSGGTPPYTYTWSFTDSNSSTLVDLSGFTANELIYDNAITAEFRDMSFGPRNAADTTRFVSPPYSYSMVPSGETSALVFFTKIGFSYTQFQTIDLYVNGGDVGGQHITAGLIDDTFDGYNELFVSKILTPSVPSIPANSWAKVSFPIPDIKDTFYGFVIRASGSKTQAKIYFDDIKLMNNVNTLTVTDAAKCKVVTNDVNVPSPRPIVVKSVVHHVSCNNGANGGIDLQLSGGTAPYTVTWNGSPGSINASNLQSGVHSISVTDANKCAPTNALIEVLKPSILNVQTTVEAPKCYGGSGSITARATGGVPSVTYAWTSSNQFTISPRPAPLAIFTDSFLLQDSFYANIGATGKIACESGNLAAQSGYCALLFSPLASSTTLLSVGCPSCFDFSVYGSIKFWINLIDSVNPQLVADFAYDGSIVYSEAITASGSGWREVTITLPTSGSADTFTLTKGSSTTERFMLDTISLVPKSQSPSDGKNVAAGFTSVVEGPAGDYILTLSDSNSCPTVTTVTIPSASAIIVSVSVTEGNAAVSVNGGSPPYKYNWQELNKTTSSISGLQNGTYTIIVSDANGCSQQTSVVIGSSSSSSSSSSSTTSPPDSIVSSSSSLSISLYLAAFAALVAFLL